MLLSGRNPGARSLIRRPANMSQFRLSPETAQPLFSCLPGNIQLYNHVQGNTNSRYMMLPIKQSVTTIRSTPIDSKISNTYEVTNGTMSSMHHGLNTVWFVHDTRTALLRFLLFRPPSWQVNMKRRRNET